MTHETTLTIIKPPEGYMENASGSLIPTAKVKDIDKLRDSVVRDLIVKAKAANVQLGEFKGMALGEIAAFVSVSALRFDAQLGGEKGNVTLLSYDGRYKIQRAIAQTVVFDEGLQAAQTLITECLKDWTKDGNEDATAVINQAFNVDKEGNVSTSRVLGLRTLKITDPRWNKAMEAINESMRPVSSKAYLRFYERDERSGEYLPLSLDVASV